METCVDSDYMQPENDAAKEPRNAHTESDFCLSKDAEEEDKQKDSCQVSKVNQEIALQEQSSSQGNAVYNGARRKIRRHQNGTKANVLKKNVTETGSQSVQKKTKINNSNVPDRLGKYVSCSVRCETKSSGISEGRSKGVPSEVAAGRDGYTETKIALLGNECLSNKEADRLRNCFESDLETKNIFENLFDECLDSTSKRKGVSSQGNGNGESGGGGGRAEEKTPEKRQTEAPPSGAPVKVRDHSSYYRSHKNIRHVCEYCHKIFKSNGKLNSHVYSHTGERPFDCSHCGKAFSSKFKLVRHLLIHSEVRKFVCQICDRTFLRNDHLKNHYKVHDPQKKMYKCPKENCDKEYSSVMSHKKHMAYHNVEDGDLRCLICSVKFETKEEALYHLKSHSGSRLFKTQNDKKFNCEFCGRLFLTRKDVTRHLVVHTGERDFLCQFCPQRFGRKDHLVRHIRKSHRKDHVKPTVLPGKNPEGVTTPPGPFTKISTPPLNSPEPPTSPFKSPESPKPPLNSPEPPIPTLDSPEAPNAPLESPEPPIPLHNSPEPPNPPFNSPEPPNPPLHSPEPPYPPFNSPEPPNPPLKSPEFPIPSLSSPEPSNPLLKIPESPVPTLKSPEPPTPPIKSPEPPTKESNTQTEDTKTHILITVQGKALQSRKKKLHKRPFQKNESLVPKKKQVPLPEGTQILLQDVPNILIIPNNSIILLRNQTKKDTDHPRSSDHTPSTPPPQPKPNHTLPSPNPAPEPPQPSQPSNHTDFINFNYDPNIFPEPPPDFIPGFPETEPFFHPDLPPFGSHFDEPDFDIPVQTDLLPRTDLGLPPNALPNGALFHEPPRAPTTAPPKPNREKTANDSIDKGLFGDGHEALMLNESILNEFKDDSAAILPADNDVGILGNILNQNNDNCGFELLRHLLTSENPVPSPLPGFNQIFHNSNANSTNSN